MSNSYRVAVLTSSDKGYAGEREDKSGPLICEIMQQADYTIVASVVLPDEQDKLSAQMQHWCDNNIADLILTTGGTGFSPRDCMPEATAAIATRQAPGIAEAIRAYSMQITPRAMLSRATSCIRGNTLIINLPGSPKAVKEALEYILPQLLHGLDVLCGNTSECARK